MSSYRTHKRPPYGKRPMSKRVYAPRKTYVYRKRPNYYVKGRGAYYIKGDLHGTAEGDIPGVGKFTAGGNLAGGYATDNYLQGLGAYNVAKIRKNTLIMSDPPSIKNSGKVEGGTVIRHREYLGQIMSSDSANTFKIQSYPLNPAQSDSFPWLSSIAANFEEYTPNGVMYEFRSTCSDAIASSTNLALGQIMLACQYDPLDAPFASDVEMLNYEFAQSCKVSESVCHFVECDPKQSPLTHLYTRPGAPTGDSDLRFSDFGTFHIASTGLQGTEVALGQLWATYEFIFFKPKVSLLSPVASNLFKYYSDVVTQTNPFGAPGTYVYSPNNNLQCTVKQTSLTLPDLAQPTSYMIAINYFGYTAMGSSRNTFTFANCVRIECWNDGGAVDSYAPQDSLANATRTSDVFVVSTIPTGAPIITSGIDIAWSGAKIDVVVTEIAYFDPNVYGSG